MVKIFKTCFLEIGRDPEPPRQLSQLFWPEVALVTDYDSGKDLGNLVDPQGDGSYTIELSTGIGTFFESGGVSSRRIFGVERIAYEQWDNGAVLGEYSGDLVEGHVEKCAALEGRFGVGIEQIVNLHVSQIDTGDLGNMFVTSVGHSKDGIETFTLETKFRAPRYFLPDGFQLNGNRFFDISVHSAARKTDSGIVRSSGIFTGDGSPIQVRYPDDIPQLIEGHKSSIQTFLKMLRDHYGQSDDNYRAQDLLERRPGMLSLVDHWDYKERQLMESARNIARAIYQDSPLSGQIKGVVLYGSLARRDKIPGDIDLMLLVDSKEGQLDPFKYFMVDKQGRPARYNVADVTNGIARELGIIPALLRIGRKSKGPYIEYPDEVDYIQFSEFGGGINLSVVSTEFFRDPALRERYMRICFTPTYFQDALTDGLAFDVASGAFSIPTQAVYSGVIASLKGEIEKAVIDNWPNIGNVRPEKTF